MILTDFRWVLSLIFGVVLFGCSTTPTASNELDEWDIDTEQIGCVDTKKSKLRCERGQVVTNAGCGEDTTFKRCASCTPIEGITCAANSAAIEVPDCAERDQGDCVIVETRVTKPTQNETE